MTREKEEEGKAERSSPAHRKPAWLIATLLVFVIFAQPAFARPPHEASAQARVPVPVGDVWELLADVDSWPQFETSLRGLAVGSGTSGCLNGRFEVITLGFTMVYSASIELARELGEIRIDLDPTADNDIEALSTVWRVAPRDGGASTDVTLVSRFRSGLPVPGFLEQRGLARAVSASVEHLVQHIEAGARSQSRAR